ncbi:ABC-three component system protein [Pseudomonas huaxiensis]|uniref:ABC-three component system protein n=1 Tax=Pseudomonas huaxiensis TaxID=2213017 RepID=UPI001300A65B|nr:ABC-three component system protein [Pseudomonas huaxiensis]
MTEPIISYGKQVTEFVFGFSVLNSNKIDLCLAQTSMPDWELVKDDLSRSQSVNAFKELFVGGDTHPQAILVEMIPSSEAVVVIAPEFAFGFMDWDSLDSYIRASETRLIVIAGFGAALGSSLIDWESQKGETTRHFGWNAKLSHTKPVNGAWCWVHQPGVRTDCIAIRKNVAEQSTEAVELPNMQYGKEVLHLKFNDLDLFPLICADLLPSASASIDSPQSIIKSAVMDEQRKGIPVLVTGSLWQKGYNRNWEAAISDVLHHIVPARPVALALCNIAYDKPTQDEGCDRWRSLSGVYVKFQDMPKGQKNLPAGRALDTATISGVVVRDTNACVVGGKLGWRPYTPVLGNFAWHPDALYHIKDEGIDLAGSHSNSAVRCEVNRQLRRFPCESEWDPRVATGMEQIKARVNLQSDSVLSRFVSSILYGVESEERADIDGLHESENFRYYLEGIYAIATLKTLGDTEWVADHKQYGQVVVSGASNLLVWNHKAKTARSIVRSIELWLNNPIAHPALIVFGGRHSGSVPQGAIVPSRRSDITGVDPQSSGKLNVVEILRDGDDITRPKILRKAAYYSIDQVSDVYLDFDPNDPVARVDRLLQVIKTSFEERV